MYMYLLIFYKQMLLDDGYILPDSATLSPCFSVPDVLSRNGSMISTKSTQDISSTQL